MKFTQEGVTFKQGFVRAVCWFIAIGVGLAICFGLAQRLDDHYCYKASPDRDPSLPTIAPPLPTYIVKDDGRRLDCAPGYSVCWESES